MRMSFPLLIIGVVAIWACQATASDSGVGVVKPHSRGLHGYIGYSASRPPDRSQYSAGMGFHSAVWPLIDKPIAWFQIGLPSAWITPDNSDNKDKPLAPVGTLALAPWSGRGQPTDRTCLRRELWRVPGGSLGSAGGPGCVRWRHRCTRDPQAGRVAPGPDTARRHRGPSHDCSDV